MGITAIAVLAVAAVLFGLALRYFGDSRVDLSWLAASIGAGVGGYVASEFLGAYGTWGPELDGLFVLPALIGAVVIGGLANLAMQRMAEPAL